MIPRPSFASIAATLALMISLLNAIGQIGRAEGSPQAVAGTAFTYQGLLEENGTAANGNYDFEFALYSAATTGSQIGSSIAINNVAVAKGIFTVQLDFGNPYWQQQTYLEVRVRKSGASTYTTLTPRQAVTAAPLANALPGVYANPANQFVGIGRNNKITSREVFGVNADFGESDMNYGGMYVNTVAPQGLPFYGFATNGVFRAWTTYNPNPDNVLNPNLNNGAWELYNAHPVSNRPLIQVRSNSIAQQSNANGLVKAGVFANCSSTSSTISRSFVSIVPPSASVPPSVSIAWNSTLDACVINFGFNIDQRYYVATANAASASFVACAYSSSTSLYCKRFKYDGSRENGFIIVLIY